MQKITPHVWFDKEAKEAAEYYTSIFENSEIKNITTLHDTPSGDAVTVNLTLMGQEFMFISAGPYFKVNPSISFLVAVKTRDEVEYVWKMLSDGGQALMELGEYPFSEKYGWIQDKYGLSWQIMFVDNRKIKQNITPTLMFVGDVCGKTEEAIQFYASVFYDATIGEILRYEKGEEPDKVGTIKHVSFSLEGFELAAMDSALKHEFSFNEAISFIVNCNNQDEIDYYWGKLSALPEAEQCGWLKDKYGISWQIVPSMMSDLLSTKDEKRAQRVTEAFLKMKKFDIKTLRKAYEGT